jgi:photosystem II stability/assembly factor-like uncharacterized protein
MKKADLHSVYKAPHQVDQDDAVLCSQLTGMSFATSETGWAVGSAQVLFTRDGGLTWLNQFEPQLRVLGMAPWSVRAVDANTSWLIGLLSGGDLYCCYTRDAGVSWQPKRFQPKFFPRDVFFVGSKKGWIAGDDGDYNSSHGRMLFITNDAGDSWDQIRLALAGKPSCLRFLKDGRRGWLIEQRLTTENNAISSYLYSSTDGGLQWEEVVQFDRDIGDLCVLDAQTLFVAGEDGFASSTTDGGQTWQRLKTGCRGFINSIEFYNKHLGLLLSDFGVLLLTQDGGETWERISDKREVGNLIAAVFLSETQIALAANRGIYNLQLQAIK